jgi:hypothetical protein
MPLTAYRTLSPLAQVVVALFLFSIVLFAVVWVATRITFDKGQLILFITTVIGFAGTAWREYRNRKWAKKDREDELNAQTAEIISRAQAEATALLIQTEAKARALHFQTLATAERIRQDTLVSAQIIREDQRKVEEHLAEKIAQVHTVAVDAVREANDVNQKIANLNQRLLSSEETHDSERKPGEAIPSITTKLNDIQTTADTIEDKVDALKKKKDQ